MNETFDTPLILHIFLLLNKQIFSKKIINNIRIHVRALKWYNEKTRAIIIEIFLFRLMPGFKMAKNMLRGKRRCTRRRRWIDCEWDRERGVLEATDIYL